VNISEKLIRVQKSFRSEGIPDSELEASILIATAIQETRSTLYANLYEEIPQKYIKAIDEFVQRRLKREPLAYILRNREFYGLQLEVSRGVFIPRPETELLVDIAIARIRNMASRPPIRVVELGTGSGAISIAVASNVSGITSLATDISDFALGIAKKNAMTHGVSDSVKFLRRNLLACFSDSIDVLIANLPYIKSSRVPDLAPEIYLHEPIEALDGGEDGCSLIIQMLEQAKQLLREGSTILLEMDPEQFTIIGVHARKLWPAAHLTRHIDLAGYDRILEITINP
tara:strand:- start:2771 stop:3628 length:858 start_codon:yes stop_codon:yes gene_type:complete